MKNNGTKFGLIAGLITASFTVVGAIMMHNGPEGLGYKNSELLGYTGILLAFSMIVIGMIKERQLYNGFITYKNAFMVGLKISLIATVLYVAAWMIMTAIYPEILDGMFAMMEENLKSSKLSPEDLQDQLNQMEQWKTRYANPIWKAVLTSMEIFPIGVAVSLIAAIFIQRKPNTSAETV